jgi:hypothetical protein
MNPSRLAAGSPVAEKAQQRRHDRHQVEIPGILRLQEARGGIYTVTVLDISTTGLRISCPKAVASGTRVEVSCQSTKVSGSVKYARDVGTEIYLGIEVDAILSPTAHGDTSDPAEIDLLSLFPTNVSRLKRP